MRAGTMALLLLLVFAGVGFATAKLVVAHATSAGAMQAEVRLAGAMAGLFAGGAAAVLAGLALLLGRRPRP